MNNRCIVCKNTLDKKIISFFNMPSGAQIMPGKDELSSDKGIDLTLKRCPVCGLVQFDCEPVDYYKKVIRAVGISDTMKKLRKDDFDLLIDRYHMADKKWFECGCGDGSFLEIARDYPADIYGSEYDENNLSIARVKINTDNIIQFFPDDENNIILHGPFDVFLSFNFLEHQIDPLIMLKCLYNNLKDDGIGLITVPSFEYIYKQGYYYEFIRDHLAYFDLNSLSNLCHLANLEVLQHDYIGIKDTLRIVVRKTNRKFHLIKDDTQYNYDIFNKNHHRINKNIDNLLDDLRSHNRTLALWGASHQSFTLLSTTKLAEISEYIIDSASFKQGLYSPVSHLPIVSKEHFKENPVDAILITAPGYIEEITQLINRLSDRPIAIYNILDLSK